MPNRRDRNGRWQHKRLHVANWPLLGVFATIVLAVVVYLYWLHAPLRAWVVSASLVAFAVYGWDKWSASQGRYRVPEMALWLLEAIGGTPGAFLAMLLFRHKVSKTAFLAPFIGIAVVQAVVVYLMRAQLAKWW